MTVRIMIGDVREKLRELPEQSVHCVVCSPPYWGLRDYGVEGQIGLEATPQEFIATMTDVFREVRRVLRDDGTCWLNMGDSYAANRSYQVPSTLMNGDATNEAQACAGRGMNAGQLGLKPKDLVGMPWRLAFALQEPYYAGRIKDERDRIWLAAMIDAEGCFFIHKRKAGTLSGSKFTRADGTEVNYERTADTFGVGLEICNTSLAIIEKIQRIVGCGTVTSQTPEQNPGRKQTIHRWRVRPNETKNLARELYPHLVAKQHQARLVYSCPSAGDAGAAAHAALIGLHRGIATTIDYSSPPSMFEPGWFLRQDVIWSKRNPMPESVRDRCTKSHEYVFLLSKSERYYFDQEAISEPCSPATNARLSQDVQNQIGSLRANGGDVRPMKAGGRSHLPGNKTHRGADAFEAGDAKHRTKAGLVKYATKVRKLAEAGSGTKNNDSFDAAMAVMPDTRNKRSVWTITTKGFSEAHFATFPPELPETCIKAGCPPGGTVLDPFFGAGTTGLVADRLQRDCIGIELNPAYAEMARRRIQGESPLFAEVTA